MARLYEISAAASASPTMIDSLLYSISLLKLVAPSPIPEMP
ncbi:Uncharacterised protein [Mycolicibacterium fortuitum]|uniref:Uncharacterized protein n=1 Tax=Mycolicibacterium fortuitum TaxID=1766 RepID=A0A378UXA8_MYCFO|nr:Uncharacterised protein [Mycolicibacterium fortuitum]